MREDNLPGQMNIFDFLTEEPKKPEPVADFMPKPIQNAAELIQTAAKTQQDEAKTRQQSEEISNWPTASCFHCEHCEIPEENPFSSYKGEKTWIYAVCRCKESRMYRTVMKVQDSCEYYKASRDKTKWRLRTPCNRECDVEWCSKTCFEKQGYVWDWRAHSWVYGEDGKPLISAGRVCDWTAGTRPVHEGMYECEKDSNYLCNRWGSEQEIIDQAKSEMPKGYSCAGCCWYCSQAPQHGGKCKYECRKERDNEG